MEQTTLTKEIIRFTAKVALYMFIVIPVITLMAILAVIPTIYLINLLLKVQI